MKSLRSIVAVILFIFGFPLLAFAQGGVGTPAAGELWEVTVTRVRQEDSLQSLFMETVRPTTEHAVFLIVQATVRNLAFDPSSTLPASQNFLSGVRLYTVNETKPSSGAFALSDIALADEGGASYPLAGFGVGATSEFLFGADLQTLVIASQSESQGYSLVFVVDEAVAEQAFAFAFADVPAIEVSLGASATASTAAQSSAALDAYGPPTVEEVNGMPLVYVPEGCFTMGMTQEALDLVQAQCDTLSGNCGGLQDSAAGEMPAHEVCLSAFWIGQTEVTNAQYKACMDAGACDLASNGYIDDPKFADYPVVNVEWSQAAAFAEWMGASLPTEAQWEYAARGPESWIYPWGNEFDGALANSCDATCQENWANPNYDDGYSQAAPVGSYPGGASWVGALDMVGNAFEFTADWYAEDYYASISGDSLQDPTGPESGELHVLKGCGHNCSFDGLRLTNRGGAGGYDPFYRFGFRIALPDPLPSTD